MALLLSLPVEILLYVVSFLYTIDDSLNRHGNKNNVLSIRLACRYLAAIGEAVIFRDNKVVQDDEGFRRLSELAMSPLCRQVYIISCYFETHSIERSSKSTMLDKETRFQIS